MAEFQLTLPSLTGSEKQISWAESIRKTKINDLTVILLIIGKYSVEHNKGFFNGTRIPRRPN